MGYGIPAAIGAKAARPDATVVCIDGDGCFQMTCQELATAALERLPIVAVVINNGWLGMVRQWQEMFYAERFAADASDAAVPDYAQLAEAYGCAGFTVETEDELEAALAAAFDCGRTAVVDVRCDPEEKCFPMVPAGAAAVDVIEAPDEEEVRAMSHTHDLASGSRTSRARWRACRSCSRAAATTSRASRSGRPSGRTSRGSRCASTAASTRSSRSRSRCTSS